ncbi:MAG: hypothetical protein JXX28_06020 [Deltaproteobacteria bacterium]|nr:hypothetical protein [Deltaproteobacteria bacterium]
MPFIALPPDLPPQGPPQIELTEPAPASGTSFSQPSSVAFRDGDIDVMGRFAMNGYGWSPLSALTALIGWYEFQAAVDVGVLEIGDMTLGVGGEIYYTRPYLLEFATETFVNLWSGDENLSWRAVDKGLAGRATVHYTKLASVDLYGVGLLGLRDYALDIDLQAEDYALVGGYETGGLKFGLGAGMNSVNDSGWIGGMELRYLAGYRFKKAASLVLTNPDGEEEELYDMRGAQKPPRGFSWVFQAGHRF